MISMPELPPPSPSPPPYPLTILKEENFNRLFVDVYLTFSSPLPLQKKERDLEENKTKQKLYP